MPAPDFRERTSTATRGPRRSCLRPDPDPLVPHRSCGFIGGDLDISFAGRARIGIGVFVLAVTVFAASDPAFFWWSLPGADHPGLPKRSIGALCLLIAYHPFRFYLEGRFYGAETRADIARMHEQFPIIWLFKHLDTALLLALIVWAALRRAEAQRWEKASFHWLLFVCTLWAVCAFNDSFLGFALPFLLDGEL